MPYQAPIRSLGAFSAGRHWFSSYYSMKADLWILFRSLHVLTPPEVGCLEERNSIFHSNPPLPSVLTSCACLTTQHWLGCHQAWETRRKTIRLDITQDNVCSDASFLICYISCIPECKENALTWILPGFFHGTLQECRENVKKFKLEGTSALKGPPVKILNKVHLSWETDLGFLGVSGVFSSPQSHSPSSSFPLAEEGSSTVN